MASGTAVVASDIPAVRETCGDGAEFFDPYDADALARLIGTYCTDEAARAELARRGRDHVLARQQQIRPTAAADAICADLAAG